MYGKIDTILSFNKHLNSPYAKPNHWGIAELKRDISETKRQLEISTAKEVKENFQQKLKSLKQIYH